MHYYWVLYTSRYIVFDMQIKKRRRNKRTDVHRQNGIRIFIHRMNETYETTTCVDTQAKIYVNVYIWYWPVDMQIYDSKIFLLLKTVIFGYFLWSECQVKFQSKYFSVKHSRFLGSVLLTNKHFVFNIHFLKLQNVFFIYYLPSNYFVMKFNY